MNDQSPRGRRRTRSGRELTDELIEKFVDEAEAGFDVARLRVRGRPRMGTAPARSFPVRLEPALRAALDERAAEEHRPAAEVVRDALRRYLAAS